MDSRSIRVLTYNIRSGGGSGDVSSPLSTPSEGTTDRSPNAYLSRVAEVIEALDSDIVALQEVDRFWSRSGRVDQPHWFSERLGMNVCFAANLEHGSDDHSSVDHQYGVAILSKHAITASEQLLLPTPPGWEQRGLLTAEIEIDDRAIVVMSTHLQAGWGGTEAEAQRQRAEQALAVAKQVSDAAAPVILMGDFNALANDPELIPLLRAETGLRDAWTLASPDTGLTWPTMGADGLRKRIDYIFVQGPFQIERVDVIRDERTCTASDHYPVMAELLLVIDGG